MGKGKERVASPAAAAVDQVEAPETVVAAQEAQRFAGVNRMAQPSAEAHRLAGSRAVAAKRSAEAMSPEERTVKRRADQQRRRQEQRDAAAAAATAEKATLPPMMQDLSWHPGRPGGWCDWHNMSEEHPLREEYAALLRRDLPAALEVRRRLTRDPFDREKLEANVAAGCFDWSFCRVVDSTGDRCDREHCRCLDGPRGWLVSQEERDQMQRVREEEQRRREQLAAAKAAADAAYDSSECDAAHASTLDELNQMLAADGQDPIDEPEFDAFTEWLGEYNMNEESYSDWRSDADGWPRWVQDQREAAWDQQPFDSEVCSQPASTGNSGYEEVDCALDSSADCHIRSPSPPPPPPPPPSTAQEFEQLSAEARHHASLAPYPVRGADGSIIMAAVDPEGETPYYYQPDDAGEPWWRIASPTGWPDRSTFYAWLERGVAWLPGPVQRRLRPTPYRHQYPTQQAFRDAQAEWYQERTGSDLKGSRRQQNTLFDRLRDRVLGSRRARANPSGS